MTARTLPLNKRGFNFETFMWAFTRFTVIAMYGLMLAGLLVAKRAADRADQVAGKCRQAAAAR